MPHMRAWTETYHVHAIHIAQSTTGNVVSNAVLSNDQRYRYRLYRQWNKLTGSAQESAIPRIIMWVMMNPSTADALVDDPTIRRCISFSKQWGYDALYVGNVYAYRSTDPNVILKLLRDGNTVEAQGPENYKHLVEMGHQSARVVYAWGKNAGPGIEHTLGLYEPLEGFWCLGKNKDGTPKHPLYIKSTQPMLPF